MEKSSFEQYLDSCAAGGVMQLGGGEAAREQKAEPISAQPLPTLGCIEPAGGCTRCAEVCPTGANVVLEFGSGSREILHLAEKCTGCGKCREACPFDGDPAADKFTMYATQAEYTASRSAGFLLVGEGRYIVRYGCMQQGFAIGAQECRIPLEYATLIEAAARRFGV